MAYISEACPYITLTKKTDCSVVAKENYQFTIYRTVKELSIDWDILTQDASIFLHRNYLEALENAAPAGYQFFYLMCYRDGKAVGVAIAQHFLFRGYEGINIDPTKGKLRSYLQKQFLRLFNVGFLTLGNATLTGEHGFTFADTVPKDIHVDLLNQGITQIIKQYSLSTHMLVIKDFLDQDGTKNATPTNGFHQVYIQPTMLLTIPTTWNTFDDYLADLSSKYRVRAKRAFKKLGAIQAHWLNESEIVAYQKQLFRLYQSVAENADLNVMNLPENYFASLKDKLGSDFHVLGYFLDGRLVGFCSVINNQQEVEAHFLGFESKINYAHQLYLNMLFDIIRYAIHRRAERISFSRTALEIKSSVGAVPYQVHGYVKHRNPLLNLFVPFFFRWFEAEKEWVQRHPFKS